MQPIQVLLVLAVWIVALTIVALLTVRLMLARQRVQRRIFADAPGANDLPAEDEQGRLAAWLFLAGFRDPNAATVFVGLTLLGVAAGVLLYIMFRAAGSVELSVQLAMAIPGHVGEVMLPLIYAGPWLAVTMVAGAPALVVRAARRRRVQQVEQDLPIVLDMLATLAEAGLGLDAAIDRLLDSMPEHRALPQELRAFQRDNLAGRPRVDSLRLLGRRVAVPWFSIFISAVVQAEQIGAGLAEVLKVQAEDLRQRRKEQALAVAMSAPVKLLFPLIVCFMPGVFVASMGPVFYEIFQFLDNFMQGMGRS